MYLSMANKLSVNRIRVTDSEIPPAGVCPDSYELHLMFGHHTLVNTSGSLPQNINSWSDVSGAGRNFTQSAEALQPQWNGNGYTFSGVDQQLGATGDAITPMDDFTIGFAVKTTSDLTNGVLIADNTSNQDFIRITNQEQIDIKADNQLRQFTLDGTLPDETPYSVVITRASNVVRIYIDGTIQSGTATFSATKVLDLNTIGVRNSNLNDFAGTLGEVIIYSCSDSQIVNAMISRLDVVKRNM